MPPLVDLALQAAESGEKAKLTKIYKYSLLADQSSGTKCFIDCLCNSLENARTKASQLAAQGNMTEGAQRLRLVFNVAANLSGTAPSLQLNEAENWLNCWQRLSIPEESYLGPLSDYAMYLARSGDYKAAIPVLKIVTKKAPENADAYGYLAQALKLTGEKDQAAEALTSYRTLANREMGSHKRSVSLKKEGYFGDLQRSCNLTYDGIYALIDRQPEDAISVLDQAMELDPGCPIVVSNLAIAFNNLAIQNADHPKSALKALHQAQALAPWNPIIRTNIEGVLRIMGQDPKSFQTRVKLAKDCFDLHDYLGALVEYRAALKLRDDSNVKSMLHTVAQKLAAEELMPGPIQISQLHI
jgi:tetratricopeptide (TPR) repeat protein